jgi:hypothetical protein
MQDRTPEDDAVEADGGDGAFAMQSGDAAGERINEV